jgi:hypothetical protein
MKGKAFKEAVIKTLESIPDDKEVLCEEPNEGLCPATGIGIQPIKVFIDDTDESLPTGMQGGEPVYKICTEENYTADEVIEALSVYITIDF